MTSEVSDQVGTLNRELLFLMQMFGIGLRQFCQGKLYKEHVHVHCHAGVNKAGNVNSIRCKRAVSQHVAISIGAIFCSIR